MPYLGNEQKAQELASYFYIYNIHSLLYYANRKNTQRLLMHLFLHQALKDELFL